MNNIDIYVITNMVVFLFMIGWLYILTKAFIREQKKIKYVIKNEEDILKKWH